VSKRETLMSESLQDLSIKTNDTSVDTDGMLDSQISTFPGRILRAAREELNYSIEQVAQELHLRPSVVLAMEEEKYDDFSSDVFLKGYFRSYCRLVNLHEQRMVDLLESQLQGLKKGIDDAAQLIKKDKQAKKQKKVLIGLVFVTLVLGGSAFVISLFYPSAEPTPQYVIPAEQALTPKELPDNVAPEKIDSEYVAIENSSTNTTSVAPFQDKATTPVEIIDKAIAKVDQIVDQPVKMVDNIDEVKANTDKKNFEAEILTVESNVEPINENTVIVDSKFDAIFSGDCWFKLVDGNQKTIFAALKRNGDRISYLGVTPFKVVLGDASKVILSFDGDTVNLKSHTANNGRAQLTLTKS
jgi:cytoskeleton protein RodZ